MIDRNDLLLSRLNEYVELSFERNGYLKFTEFLDEYQCSAATVLFKTIYFENYRFFGGYDDATRRMVAVYSFDCEPENAPITVLKLVLSDNKYLSHRDILGSLMNLNIERSLIGDICIIDGQAFVVCTEIAAKVIRNELATVGKSHVTVSETDELSEYTPSVEELTFIIASERLDCIVSAVMKIGRSKAEELISAGSVFVSGVAEKNNSKKMKEDVKISIRGFGKFLIVSMSDKTNRGRTKLVIKKFI